LSFEQHWEESFKEIQEVNTKNFGEFVVNEEEDKLNDLINLAMMLGEAYVYRDSIVTLKVKTEEV
jgi:hypothetical protein